MKKKKTLIVIDGMSLVYRAFHAIPSTFANQQGLPTNAVYGFTQTLRKILKDFAPDYVAVAFDVKGPSFRHEMFAEYKAERPPMPDLLSVQIPYVKKVIRAFGIAVLESESFEADDIIASVAKKLSFGRDDVDAIVDGFHFILLLRLRCQLRLGDNPALANRVNPDELNELDRHILKEAFRQARKLQARLQLDYRL